MRPHGATGRQNRVSRKAVTAIAALRTAGNGDRLLVFNVTKDDIRVRMAAIDEEIWPTAPTRPEERDPKAGDTFSDFTNSGKEQMADLVNQIYAEFNNRNGTNVSVPK